MGMPKESFSPSHRACLFCSDGNSEGPIYLCENDSELEKAIQMFNVNDSRPQLRKTWFSKLKGLEVLHIGGWPGSTNHFVENEDNQFLRGPEDIKGLQLLSLQGFLGIVELPDSILELMNLKTLDLQACHNLAKLPMKRKLLNLTHLDISGCFWLDLIPKEVARLSELRVLKGFVVERSSHGSSCSLDDLVHLQKPRKIYITPCGENFLGENYLTDLKSFQDLEKRMILRGNSSWKPTDDRLHKAAEKHSDKGESDHPSDDEVQHPPRRRPNNARGLKKLEMQGFPGIALPSWTLQGLGRISWKCRASMLVSWPKS